MFVKTLVMFLLNCVYSKTLVKGSKIKQKTKQQKNSAKPKRQAILTEMFSKVSSSK